MRNYYIDQYNYCSDEKKDEFYRNHILTSEEKKKTDEFMEKMDDFVVKTNGEKGLRFFHNWCPEGNIQYREGLGYITIGNYDRDIISVDGYGQTIEEAFFNATIDCEFYFSECYECEHRKELNMQYSERFLNGDYSEDDYHGPFFFAELALQDFRKYYGDNIPEEIINLCENYLKKVNKESFKYDYGTNRFIKAEKENTLIKKNTNN